MACKSHEMMSKSIELLVIAIERTVNVRIVPAQEAEAEAAIVTHTDKCRSMPTIDGDTKCKLSYLTYNWWRLFMLYTIQSCTHTTKATETKSNHFMKKKSTYQ